jgi:hypothetical protein
LLYASPAGPSAIQQFFDAVAKDPSMITGAWVFMLETDYVWMKPMQVSWAQQV